MTTHDDAQSIAHVIIVCAIQHLVRSHYSFNVFSEQHKVAIHWVRLKGATNHIKHKTATMHSMSPTKKIGFEKSFPQYNGVDFRNSQ